MRARSAAKTLFDSQVSHGDSTATRTIIGKRADTKFSPFVTRVPLPESDNSKKFRHEEPSWLATNSRRSPGTTAVIVAVLCQSWVSSFPIDVKVAPGRSSLGGWIRRWCSGWDHSVWRPKSARYSHTRSRGASITMSLLTSRNTAGLLRNCEETIRARSGQVLGQKRIGQKLTEAGRLAQTPGRGEDDAHPRRKLREHLA